MAASIHEPECTTEVVNITAGELFLALGMHRERPDKVAECEQMMAFLMTCPAVCQEDREKMGLEPAFDYRSVQSSARVSRGIGAFLQEETRVYGHLYLRSMREFRNVLHSDTVAAWDISCAYQAFMSIISLHPHPRLDEMMARKIMIRTMVAVAYRVSLEAAKEAMHAITNGKSSLSWRREEQIEALTLEHLHAAAPELTKHVDASTAVAILQHPGWAVRDGDLVWLLEYQHEIAIAQDDVHSCEALGQLRRDVESTRKWRDVDSKKWHGGKLTTVSYQLQALERLCISELHRVVCSLGGRIMASAHDEGAYFRDPPVVDTLANIPLRAKERCEAALSARLDLLPSRCHISFEEKVWKRPFSRDQLLQHARSYRPMLLRDLKEATLGPLLPHLSHATLLELFSVHRTLPKREEDRPAAPAGPTQLDPCTSCTQLDHPYFFERQQSGFLRCGLHALNNLVGKPMFSPLDMTTACDVFIAESLVPSNDHEEASPENRSDHEHASGYYSVEVMAFVLRRSMQYELMSS